jgi:hypothetical protein
MFLIVTKYYKINLRARAMEQLDIDHLLIIIAGIDDLLVKKF